MKNKAVNRRTCWTVFLDVQDHRTAAQIPDLEAGEAYVVDVVLR